MKKIFLIAVAALIVGCSQQGGTPETYISVDSETPEMQAAYKEARRTLADFNSKIANPPKDWSDFSIKVAFPTRDDSLEHIWVADIEVSSDKYVGRVANDPVNVAGMKLGDPVEFKSQDVSDWQYMKNGKLYGHYTTRAMMHNMSPDQQAQLATVLGVNPQ